MKPQSRSRIRNAAYVVAQKGWEFRSCPVCSASPGDRCINVRTTNTMRLKKPHKERKDMKFRTFTGDTSDLTSKGRSELPETVMIRDAMKESATEGGKKIEFVELTKAEIEKTKSRIPNIAGRFGYSYRMWDVPGGVVLSATFKKGKAVAEPTPEPEPEVKPKPGPRRSARKATASA